MCLANTVKGQIQCCQRQELQCPEAYHFKLQVTTNGVTIHTAPVWQGIELGRLLCDRNVLAFVW